MRYVLKPHAQSRALRALSAAVTYAADCAVWLGAEPAAVVAELWRCAAGLADRWRGKDRAAVQAERAVQGK